MNDRAKGTSMFGLVLALGFALSWFSHVHPAEMPFFGPWEFSWTEYLGSVLALTWYFRGIVRMLPAARPAFWRRAAYTVGVASMYAVTQTTLTYLALHLFAATQVQQFVLHDVGPFLVALAWPGDALEAGMPPSFLGCLQRRAIPALLRIVQQPAVAALLFILLLLGQVTPAVVFRMMLDRHFFDAMNILMAVDGVLFWCLVLDPRPQPQAAVSFLTRMALAFVVMLPVMPIGAYIAFTSHMLYGFYDFCGRLEWFSPSTDQCLGGLILWIPSGLMSSVAILLPLNAMRLADEREERRVDVDKAFIQIGGRQVDASAWTGR
jgi:putative membrane protein